MGSKALARGILAILWLLAAAVPPLLGKPGRTGLQQGSAAERHAAAIQAYPESADGLKNLLQDWFGAIRAGDTAKSSQYLEGFAIPNHQEWFRETFGPAEGARLEIKYTELQTNPLDSLRAQAVRAANSKASSVETYVYRDSACTEVPQLQAISAAMARPTPIYRALIRGVIYLRSSPVFPVFGNFVYVHGGFRYFGQQVAQALSAATGMRVLLFMRNTWSESLRGGRFKPLYPEKARELRLGGRVAMHVLVATDGTIKQIQPVSGHPLLVPAAIDAVKECRYEPTLLNGKPVEFDTEISVAFYSH